jgi:shikimate kinase
LRASHIALIGFMGAGKTTLGPRLATRLRLPALDLDDAIEVDAGASVAKIFASRGEAAFRDLESRALERALNGPSLLLSTGGGIVESDSNRRFLHERSYVIWLDPPFEVLRRRLQDDDGPTRPLLTRGFLELRELLDRRRPLYAATAHARVGSPIANPARLARELARELGAIVQSP